MQSATAGVSLTTGMAAFKRRIMAPGPVEIPPEVLAAAALPIPHHRTKEFRGALQESLNALKWVLDTTSPVVLFSSSGTGAMEAAVASFFSPGDEVLVTVCGNFSERWADLCETYGLTVHRIDAAWGDPIDPRELAAKLKRHDHYAGVFTTFSETSTGVENDIQEIGKLVRATESLLIVDGISGVGALPYHMDAWGVDVTVVGSQKGLQVPPGLAFMGVSERARRRLATARNPRFYLSVDRALKALEKEALPDTPFTPPVSLILQLREALRGLKREGLSPVWERTARLGAATRAGVKALGLKLLAGKGYSSVVTAVDCAGGGPDAAEVVKRLRDDWGVSIIGGQGKLKGKIFRIGHVGYVDELDVLATLAALEMTLRRMGFPASPGAGVAAAEAVFTGATPARAG